MNDYWTGRDELGNAIDVDNPIVFGMMGYVRYVFLFVLVFVFIEGVFFVGFFFVFFGGLQVENMVIK